MNPNAQFERDLERWLQAEAPATAPAGLHAAVIDRARTRRQRPGWATSGLARWFGRNRGLTLLAAAGLLLVGGAMAAGSGVVKLPSMVPPQPAPTLPAAVTSPTAVPTASPAPSETTDRAYHTATRLPDGRVLIAGGDAGGGRSGATSLATAGLYDPATGTFGPTGSMTTGRIGPTGTRLPDGRVLVAGGLTGENSVESLATAELYDPKTGTFSPTGSMATARAWHTATLLADGRVLVAGGSASGRELATAEIYDPTAGTFGPTGSMAAPRAYHAATPLADGRVLVAGGSADTSAEIFDPTTGTFSPTGSMAAARTGHTVTLVPDGRVLVAGGLTGGGLSESLATAELYDPKAGTFSPTGSMATARWNHTATLLPDGRVLVAGGSADTVGEIYDPATGTFSPTGSMATTRASHTATLLADGRVLVAGGSAGASAEIYDPATGTFSPTNP